MRIILFVCLLSFFLDVQAQQPIKFKTANQKNTEDSISQINNPAPPTLPINVSILEYDTLIWGALASIGLVFVLPQGELKDITSNGFGYGIDGSFLVNLAHKRTARKWDQKWASIYVGAGMQYLIQGGVHDYYTIKDPNSQTNISSTIINKMWGGRLITRFEFLPYQLKIFIEGSIGANSFIGQQTIKAENLLRDNAGNLSNPLLAETSYEHNNTWVGNYTYGAGVRIGDPTFKMEFKFVNHIGQSINYVDLQSVQFDRTTSTINYTTKPTTTHMWLPQASVTYLF